MHTTLHLERRRSEQDDRNDEETSYLGAIQHE